MMKIITLSRYMLVAAIVAGGTAYMRPALAAGGYEGVVAAPSDDNDMPNNAPARAVNEPTPGYSGLVADPSAPEPTDQYTPAQDRAESPVTTDLRTSAIIHGAPHIKAPPVDFSETRHSFIAGKSAAEYMIGKHIAQAMASVNNESLSSDERAVNARNAYQNLSILADGLRSKQSIPDETYKSMGLTDTYINDERNGNAAALTQLDAALATLKSAQ